MRDDVIRVLLVEDDPEDAQQVRELFADADAADGCRLGQAGSMTEACAWLEENPCDVVLLDLTLPDCVGIETIKRMAWAAPHLPIVVLSAFDNPDFAMLALECGAQDYLLKGQRDGRVLRRVIRYAILRKQFEEYARLASARVKSIIELAHDGIVAITPDQRIVMVNPAAERLFGWPAELLHGRPLDVLIPERARAAHRRHVERFAASGEASRTVSGHDALFALARDGREFPVEITLSRTPTPEGLLFTAIIRDVTERRRAEAELRAAKHAAEQALAELGRTQARLVQAEKLSALGQLVAGVAHEVNTPIGNALTAGSFLADVGAELREKLSGAGGGLRRSDLEAFVDEVLEAASVVVGAMQRAGGLVQLFKQTAAGDAGTERCAFSLQQLLADFASMHEGTLAGRAVKLEVDCPADVLMDSHPVAITQVLANLLGNALQHGFPDGRPGRVSLGAYTDGETVRLCFSDDGVGIAPDDLPKVFEPFFTTRRGAGSTGLGLHIVFNLVNGPLSGTVNVVSAPGTGTTVLVELPRVAG